MTLVECKKCKKEISSTAKYCPHCGTAKTKYCRKCGKEMIFTETTCPSCGYPNQEVINNKQSNKGEKYDLAFIGLICSMLVPIVGLVLGFIAMNANKGLNNDARTFGQLAVVISAIEMVLITLFMILYIIMIAIFNVGIY